MMTISRTVTPAGYPGAEPPELVGSLPVVPPVTDLPLLASGKVREMYDLGDRILMVASDRISTYDVVHPTPIPDKGAVLTGLSAFWFGRTGHIVANHFVSATDDVPEDVRGRAMTVRKLDMLPVECVVRGYITGSGWKDYQATGSVSGIALPPGLRESERLPTPVFTPSTKAEEGHDEAIDFDRAAELVGDRELMARVRDVSVALYRFAADHARERGVILADTKFEFGLDADGELVVGDEVLTPDSSRYWPAEGYEAGRSQPSFDKQYVRDWAAGSGWDKTPPAPALPDDVVAGTRARYVEAYELITGEPFDAWVQRTAA
jgi:phosphoribosylaminoimidazole-succinocarboxamide synthase